MKIIMFNSLIKKYQSVVTKKKMVDSASVLFCFFTNGQSVKFNCNVPFYVTINQWSKIN